MTVIFPIIYWGNQRKPQLRIPKRIPKLQSTPASCGLDR